MVRAYYDNPGMLRAHLESWAALPRWLQRRLRAIVVDDCSPGTPAIDVVRDLAPAIEVRVFRLDVDVRWNWLGARNVGLHHAPDGWCLVTDMDHVAPVETLVSLVGAGHDPEKIYRFSRVEHTGEKIHEHPNSWFMTREMYWRVGGHDEALSGYYGTDGEYRRRCASTAPVTILREELVRHERVGDASTSRYLRKQPEDARGKQLVKSRGPDWHPLVLSFPYHEEIR